MRCGASRALGRSGLGYPDADSKLILSWRPGACDAANGYAFIGDVADRLANRV